MLHFERSTLINASVEVVWNFHERADILQVLTPPWQPVEVIRREGGLDVGAISEFRLWLGPVPVRWLAEHSECEKYRFFTDVQVEGPVVSWVHRHIFEERNGGTKLRDAIDFELPGGLVSEGVIGWWVYSRLEDMFKYRHEVTKRECEGRY